MEGLMQYHQAAFDGTFMTNHIIPSLQNVLVRLSSCEHSARPLHCGVDAF
jgi:hypothetical protein